MNRFLKTCAVVAVTVATVLGVQYCTAPAKCVCPLKTVCACKDCGCKDCDGSGKGCVCPKCPAGCGVKAKDVVGDDCVKCKK